MTTSAAPIARPREFAHLSCACILCLLPAMLFAQRPVVPARHNPFGFSYRLPPDWQVARGDAALPAAKQNAEESAKKQTERNGIACAQVVLSARRGKPASVVVVAALPFGCYGQPMTKKDLSDFATGVSQGLKQNFKVSDPVYGNYTLGTYDFWIERAVGVPRNQPKAEYTLETACTILRDSAVCWMTMAADAGGLRDFETGLVTLDHEPPVALVPLNAFVKNPLSPNPAGAP